MNFKEARVAACQFGFPGSAEVQPLGHGLIHQTFKLTATDGGKSAVLQALNQRVFHKPEDIVTNYKLIFDYLSARYPAYALPPPLATIDGQLAFKDAGGNYWRATGFMNNSHTLPSVANASQAFTVASSFGRFAGALAGMNTRLIKPVIPDFHNMERRYQDLESAITGSSPQLLARSTHTISELRQRIALVQYYRSIQRHQQYPDRLMHHDCKISNILFDNDSHQVICPVDLDTVMPGKYFSDLGDMVRTIACTADEESRDWQSIDVRKDYYQALLEGYCSAMGGFLSAPELSDIHFAGLLLTYMQSVRFATDYLQGDVYYKTEYPEQNANRALNQLILLEKLEDFLRAEYGFNPY